MLFIHAGVERGSSLAAVRRVAPPLAADGGRGGAVDRDAATAVPVVQSYISKGI